MSCYANTQQNGDKIAPRAKTFNGLGAKGNKLYKWEKTPEKLMSDYAFRGASIVCRAVVLTMNTDSPGNYVSHSATKYSDLDISLVFSERRYLFSLSQVQSFKNGIMPFRSRDNADMESGATIVSRL